MNEARADLHLHSKHSDRPSEWILRRIGAPESFVEPADAYRKARERGMDFVTLSDHNCIRGALEIAHLPNTFISNEITTYFPEDGCKIHLLALGIAESQFRFIEELRPSIYELRDYLAAEDIAHSVAHPFFRVNAKLSPLHVEKLLLLFNTFEGLNGSRDQRASQLVNLVFRNLTPEWVDRAAERHRIEPLGETPWLKRFTGGSDDHGGLYVANAYTVTPEAETAEEFLSFVRRGQCDIGGRAGSSLRLAHSFYEIAFQYYRRRFGGAGQGVDLIGEIFERLASDGGGSQEPPTSRPGQGLRSRLRGVLGARRGSASEKRLLADLAELVAKANKGRSGLGVFGETRDPAVPCDENGQEWRTFEQATGLVQHLGYRFVERLVEHLREGRLLDAFQTFASLAPVGLGVAPYIASFATQHKDESFLQEVAAHFPWSQSQRTKRGGRAWLTDTYSDTNGVAKMLQILGERAHENGLPLDILTCEAEDSTSPWQTNFQPVGNFSVPGYETQQIAFPPFLEIIESLERRDVSEVILSTPGPMGLTGLAAANLLGLRKVGVYHTDFPAYVHQMTDHASLSGAARAFMIWFYQQMDLIFVPSLFYRRQLAEWGLDEKRLVLLRRGVDVDRFSPSKRNVEFWNRFGESRDVPRFLYVGRLSEEKNLRTLLDAYARVRQTTDAELCLVGDGPLRQELERRAEGLGVLFTGFLDGDALATAFASADVFVFPSETDTFGNVVLEAQSSGLPAVVSTKGGPREIIVEGETGVAIDCSSADSLAVALTSLAQQPGLRRRLAEAARQQALQYRWSAVLEQLWRSSPSVESEGGSRGRMWSNQRTVQRSQPNERPGRWVDALSSSGRRRQAQHFHSESD